MAKYQGKIHKVQARTNYPQSVDVSTFVEIPGFENYGVNEDGIIWSFRTQKIKKTVFSRTGRERTVLQDSNGNSKAFLVHRLVAQIFLENPDNKPYINHIDNDPKNNRLENLEWSTAKENSQHAAKLGLYNRKLTETEVRLIRVLYKNGNHSYSSLAKRFGVAPWTVSQIVRGKTWKHVTSNEVA